jgi:hypothetical protein
MQPIFVQTTKQYLFSAKLRSRYNQPNTTLYIYVLSLSQVSKFSDTSQAPLLGEPNMHYCTVFLNDVRFI